MLQEANSALLDRRVEVCLRGQLAEEYADSLRASQVVFVDWSAVQLVEKLQHTDRLVAESIAVVFERDEQIVLQVDNAIEIVKVG